MLYDQSLHVVLYKEVTQNTIDGRAT